MVDAPGDFRENVEVSNETPADGVFTPPSISKSQIMNGESYTFHSQIPNTISKDKTTECVLGVDEAGRGPVLGPMVYALFYLPITMHHSLLAEKHHFDDSKVLTPAVRSELMEKICAADTDLHDHCGWATRTMSAQDISSAMLRPNGVYNLNAQAMDATVNLIQEVLDAGVNVREVYIDTIGPPASYQKKLELIFPALRITVAKKADSLYPCVSAASVCAKVTRDAALEELYTSYASPEDGGKIAWGSGYPSDARCSTWLKSNMDPLFGWGSECRFSWGTAKEMLEAKGAPCRVDWPQVENRADTLGLSNFLYGAEKESDNKMATWFGERVTETSF